MLASLALGLADAGVRVVQGVPASSLGGGEPLGPVALSYLMRGEGLGLFAMPVMMMDRGLPGTTRLRAERLLRQSQMAGVGPMGAAGGAGLAGVDEAAITERLGAWIHKGVQAGLLSGLGFGRGAREGYLAAGAAGATGSSTGSMLAGSGSEPIDVVHCFGEPRLWNLGLAVSQIARRRAAGGRARLTNRGPHRAIGGVPLLIELYSAQQIATARRWLNATAGNASRVWWLCADEAIGQELQRTVRPAAMRQVVTVPWGVSRVQARGNEQAQANHEVVILVHGGLGDEMIEAGAFVRACAEVKRTIAERGQRLVIVCDDQMQTRARLKGLMQAQQMSDDLVVLPGASEQWDMLETVDCVVCLQSQREINGLVMRAAGHGIPIVISEQAMVSWMVEGQSAAGVQPLRSESWQAALLRVLQPGEVQGSPASLATPGLSGGQSLIASRHTLSGWTESLLKVYDRAIRAIDR